MQLVWTCLQGNHNVLATKHQKRVHLPNVHSWVEAAAAVKIEVAAQDSFFSSQQVNLHLRAGSPK